MWQKVDFIKQLATTSSVVGHFQNQKHFPKPKMQQKKVMVIVLVVSVCLIYHIFLNPSKTIISEKYAQQINEMHQKLQYLRPLLVNRMDPILLHNAWLQVAQPVLQKLNWATKFCLICHIYLISRQPTTTSSSISTTFCQENDSTTSRTQKMLSKSSSNPETCIFMLQEQTNSFLIGKDVLTVMVPILINKDVFEPHYNDLKFTVCIHQGNQIWKRHVYPNVHRSTVYNSQDMEAT